jgi:hypothetical protein
LPTELYMSTMQWISPVRFSEQTKFISLKTQRDLRIKTSNKPYYVAEYKESTLRKIIQIS